MEVVSPRVRAMSRAAVDDPEAFWARAAEALPWLRRWDRVFDWEPERPDERGRYFRWFSAAVTNLACSCVDRTVAAGSGGRAARACANGRVHPRVPTSAQRPHPA